ncbi:MAG: hypothetical protein E6G15_04575, partial [Actinobacteria bacterium]
MSDRGWQLRGTAPPEQIETLSEELGLSRTTASVLVRRGYDDPAAARRFLDAELPEHDPLELGDMTAACEAIRAAIAAGTK